MARLMNIGFGNVINTAKIIAVVSPEAAPVKRMVQNARQLGKVIDATQGRRTKSVIVTENDYIVLFAAAGNAGKAVPDDGRRRKRGER